MKIDFITDINKDYTAALSYSATDRFMVHVLWWHLGVFALLAFLGAGLKIAATYPSPLAWRIISVPEAVFSVLVAIFSTLIPVLLIGTMRNHYLWRIVVTTALVVYSYLFVFISGGSIEMHFHFFIVIALLVIYSDWRLGWILLVLTGLHHGILNYIEPGWVYFYGRNDVAVIAHSLPVLVGVICTTVLCNIGRQSVINLKQAQVGLEEQAEELKKLRASLEKNELENKVKELKRTNASL